MTTQQRVEQALTDLCADPAAIARRLSGAGGLAEYLRHVTGFRGEPYRGDEPFLRYGVNRVIVFGVRPAVGRRPCDLVEMPAVLRAVVDAREAA